MTIVRGLIFLSVIVMAYFSTAEVEASEFSSKLNLGQVYKQIPQKSEFAKLSNEEVHHAPAILKKGARLLGQVAQELNDKPYRRLEGLSFYKKCALESEFPGSFRAVCLKRAQELSLSLDKKKWTPKSMDPGVLYIRSKI